VESFTLIGGLLHPRMVDGLEDFFFMKSSQRHAREPACPFDQGVCADETSPIGGLHRPQRLNPYHGPDAAGPAWPAPLTTPRPC